MSYEENDDLPEPHWADDPEVDIAQDTVETGNGRLAVIGTCLAAASFALVIIWRILQPIPVTIAFPAPALPPEFRVEIPAGDYAIYLTDRGWHEGKGWTFSNIAIDQAGKTVHGFCPK